MANGIDIYNKSFSWEKLKKKINQEKTCTENKTIIVKYLEYLAANNISLVRIAKMSWGLRQLAVWIKKPFGNVSRQDVEVLARTINLQPLSEATKCDYNRALKQFYRWFLGKGEETPKMVKWLRTRPKLRDQNRIAELLTKEDVRKLIEVSEGFRNKAFISFLYESGARIEEVLSMQIKDFQVLERYAKVRLSGKTGDRRIIIVASLPYLCRYLETHPYRNDAEAFFWLSTGSYNHNKPLKYAGSVKFLKKAFRKADINKRGNPHSFRHSRATELASHITEVQMCSYFGWVLGSGQVRTYVHASGRDLDQGILSYYGLNNTKKEQDKTLEIPVECNRCKLTNASASKFCSNCGYALSLKAAMETEETLNKETDKAFQLLIEISKDPSLLKEFEKFRNNENKNLNKD
jgi:integrase/recombinase XerD